VLDVVGFLKNRSPDLPPMGVCVLRPSVLESRRLGVDLWSDLPRLSQSMTLCLDTLVDESCRLEEELLCLSGRRYCVVLCEPLVELLKPSELRSGVVLRTRVLVSCKMLFRILAEVVFCLLATGSFATTPNTVRTSEKLFKFFKNSHNPNSSVSLWSSNQLFIGTAFSGCRH